MLITCLFIIITLFGIISMKSDKGEDLNAIGWAMMMIGLGPLIVSLIIIMGNHALANTTIEKNKIEYQGLLKRYEIVESQYEDVSKSDVIRDITEWNMEVYKAKYWAANPWTSWFNPKKVADNLHYIPLDGESE